MFGQILIFGGCGIEMRREETKIKIQITYMYNYGIDLGEKDRMTYAISIKTYAFGTITAQHKYKTKC